MEILNNYSLKNLNTFGIDVHAEKFCSVHTKLDLLNLMETSEWNGTKMLLGEGSNVLFTSDFKGLIVKNELKGIKIVEQETDFVSIKAYSGENWHSLVLYCVQHNFGGIENLSLIPGTVGAAPLQNIGAYGVELTEVFTTLGAINLESGEERSFSNDECRFGYRSSIFKNELKDKFFITDITLRLTKQHHVYSTEYGAIKEVLNSISGNKPSIKEISNAVINIRQSKLPDPAKIGNAGSFFKNPIIDLIDYEGLLTEFSRIPGYKMEEGLIKVPAAWMIEHCGWKGNRIGNIGVHDKQALVLVNHGGGKGYEIWKLAKDIQASVADTFGIELQPEVNVIE